MPAGPTKKGMKTSSPSRPFNRDERDLMAAEKKLGRKPGGLTRDSKSKAAKRKSGLRSSNLNDANPRSSSNTYLDPRKRP